MVNWSVGLTFVGTRLLLLYKDVEEIILKKEKVLLFYCVMDQTGCSPKVFEQGWCMFLYVTAGYRVLIFHIVKVYTVMNLHT